MSRQLSLPLFSGDMPGERDCPGSALAGGPTTPAPAAAGEPSSVAEVELESGTRHALLRRLPSEVASAVWIGNEIGGAPIATVPTGFPVLDDELPGGGWPKGALTEFLLPQAGIAEWRILLPALAAGRPKQPVVAVSPPYAPFLGGIRRYGLAEASLILVRAERPAQRLWATEQAARAEGLTAVVAWLPNARNEQLRRLQAAATQSSFPVFLIRPEVAQHEASPAPLRVQVRLVQAKGDIELHILKRKGPAHDGWLRLDCDPPGFDRLCVQGRTSSTAGPRHVRPSVLDGAARGTGAQRAAV
jgi:protein ImuA